jgi:cob(I)alamin adenosyltransferase
MPKIYTRTGDKGETGLVTGQRVPKDSARVEAYGTVDELNSAIGLSMSFIEYQEVNELLSGIQSDLFVLGADLATPNHGPPRIPRVNQGMVEALERHIDKFDAELRPLRAFILPGGDRGASLLFLARAIARRCERKLAALSRTEKIGDSLAYMNRLSDLLFVLGRWVNAKRGVMEKEWRSKPA